MRIPVYNQQGEGIGEDELPKEIFEVPLNSDLVHQVAVALRANKRTVIAHTKDRGEVSGGGRKPWPQKHTGRARHGSIRSPLWRKGGVVFGPQKERVFKQKINQRMQHKAIFSVLSEKAQKNLVLLTDRFDIDKPKTKLLSQLLQKFPCADSSALIMLSSMNKNLISAARNNPSLKIVQARDVNVLDLLSFKYVVMPRESIKVMRERFHV